jgi:hypothetical protein
MEITVKMTQRYLDNVEKEFNDELSSCIPKKQLKFIQNDLNITLLNIKSYDYDFSNINNIDILAYEKQECIDWIVGNQNFHLDKEMLSQALLAYVTLPQMNIDKIYKKWFNLINAVYCEILDNIQEKAQKRLNELIKVNSNELVTIFNIKNEKLATISRDGIFSFKMEPNDENTRDFLKVLMDQFQIQIKQINYFEV